MPNVPVPKTWVDADFATAPILNTELRDIFNFVLAPPRVVLSRVSALSLAPNAIVPIPWENEILDTFGGWTSASPTRYTVQVPGKYRVSVIAGFSANSTSVRVLKVRVNGASPIWTVASAAPPPSSADAMASASLVLPYTFAIGEYFEILAQQGSSATLTLSGGTDSYITAEWVGS